MRIALAALVSIAALAAPAVTAQAQAPTYEARLRLAATQVVGADRATGLAALRTVVSENPSRPEAICYLAEANRLSGDFVAALDNFQACLRVARSTSSTAFVARAMHGIASTFERMPERLAEARAAWLEYARFADGAASVASAQIGRERVSAVDVVTEQERVYVEVRQRIAERERAAATPAPH